MVLRRAMWLASRLPRRLGWLPGRCPRPPSPAPDPAGLRHSTVPGGPVRARPHHELHGPAAGQPTGALRLATRIRPGRHPAHGGRGCRGTRVLPSLFEEQLADELDQLDVFLTHGTYSHAEALTYLPEPAAFRFGPDQYLERVRVRAPDAGQPQPAVRRGARRLRAGSLRACRLLAVLPGATSLTVVCAAEGVPPPRPLSRGERPQQS